MFRPISLDATSFPSYRLKQTERLRVNLRASLIAGALISIYFVPWALFLDAPGDLKGVTILGLLALALCIFGGITFLDSERANLSSIAVVSSLFTCAAVSVLLVTIPDGFLYGVGMLLNVMVVITVLSIDMSLGTALVLLAMYLAIPNAALLATGAPSLTVMNTNWILFPGALLAFGLAFLMDQSHRRAFLLEQELATEKERSEELLHALLPAGIAERLKQSDTYIADVAPNGTILFADLADFTPMTRRLPPAELIAMLNEIFTTLDEITARHGLEKIKTIGDSYMVAAGVADASDRTVQDMAEFALDALEAVREYLARTGHPLDVRIGLSTGPVVCGVIGRQRPHFDLWGTAVNLASRLEGSAPKGTIHVDAETRQRLEDGYILTPCGGTELQGFGTVETYLLEGRADESHEIATTVPAADSTDR